MPGATGPNLGLVWGYSPHESGWGIGGYNPGFALLDTIVQLAVIDILNAPPGAPASGDRYIVGAAPTGAWVGHSNSVAVWLDAAWNFYVPKTGWRAYNVAATNFYKFDGANWVADAASSTTFASLTDVALATPIANDIPVFDGTDWVNRNPAYITNLLVNFVGDSGAGGTKGLVPAPAAGDAAAGKFLDAAGGYSVPAGTNTFNGLSDVVITSPATDDVVIYDGADWINTRPKYVIGISAPQTTAYTASQVVGHHRFAKAVTIPANFGAYLGLSSQAGGTANATGSTVINVDKAANATPNTFSNVGTITIGAGGVTPTFASSGGTAISFAQGDVVRFVMPATPDATFVGFYATIVGFET